MVGGEKKGSASRFARKVASPPPPFHPAEKKQKEEKRDTKTVFQCGGEKRRKRGKEEREGQIFQKKKTWNVWCRQREQQPLSLPFFTSLCYFFFVHWIVTTFTLSYIYYGKNANVQEI
jgi:hypothetical protein